jgi:predicted phage baseplate assembly protein
MSCKHDCEMPLVFPRPIFNRPGLNRIDYRIGTYADVRAHLLDRLNKQPVLSAFTHREADDPAIALLEGDAIVVDILAFYQRLYANEAYLRTAQWKQSIADLVRLGGYRLAPGVAGEATFALTVKGEQPVEVARGFGLKAQLEGIDKPVEFETRAALSAVPALSAFALYRPRQASAIGNGTTVLRLAPSDVPLKADDRLLLGEAIPDAANPTRLLDPEMVTVAETFEAFGERYVKLKSAVTRTTPAMQLRAYKLGQTLRHFGHGAPNTITTVSSAGVASVRATSYQRLLDKVTSTDVTPALGPLEMPLEREFDGIRPGDTLLIQGRFQQAAGLVRHRYTLVRRVSEVEKLSLTWGAQTGACTMLTLASSLLVTDAGHAHPYSDVQTLSFMQVEAAPLSVYGAYVETGKGSANSVLYYGPAAAAQALQGRRLLLVDDGGTVRDATVQSVTPAPAAGSAFHAVLLSVPVNYADYPYDAPRVTAYGNVVDASQGKTIAATPVGSGNARAVFQTFAIPKAPLTYLFDAGRTPAQAAALDLYVDGIRWTRVETLFNAGPLDQVYIVREDAEGKSFAQFGDGKTGARLKSGRNNVAAVYRVGLGAHGRLKADTEAQATGKLVRLDKVVLPGAVTTGADPEAAGNARLAAPARLQSLGRLVSIADYEAETRQLPNVLKANARWDAPDGVPAIVLTVLTQSGSAQDLAQIRAALAGYSRCRGPARHPVQVINGQRQYVYIDAVVGYDPAYLIDNLTREIKRALGVAGDEANGIDGGDGLFGLRRRDFHASVHSSEAIAAIQNVPGVAWVQLQAAATLAPGTPPPADPALLPLPTGTPVLAPVISCPAYFLLALHRHHLVLGMVSAQIQAECPA